MKRVMLIKNGYNVQSSDKKPPQPVVVRVPKTLDELLNLASRKLEINSKQIFTAKGGLIDDVELIRDDELLHVSEGETFIPTGLNSKSTQTEETDREQVEKSSAGDWVTLNVGGTCFATTKSTLTTAHPHSMLARMFAGENDASLWESHVDAKGAYLIDRSPRYFEPILNYLRHEQLVLDNDVNPLGVLEEARFFGLPVLMAKLEALADETKCDQNKMPLCRRDVVQALIRTPSHCELRFQGVNMSGADLSKLDLRFINLKYAVMQNTILTQANMSCCLLERADLSGAKLDGANLLGVKMLCANLEGASLKGCNFEDPAGSRANMEGVNMKGVQMEGSQMVGVNLRVANLRNANLQNCDLRGAVLAGADLENCDLTGSDLQEANLRGANLKGVAFDLMVTPLHMSQTLS